MDAGEGRLGVGKVGTQTCGWIYGDQNRLRECD